MMRIEWNNPKITLQQLDEFLSPYIGANYDGFNLESGYVYIRTLESLLPEQEEYILNYLYSLNDIPIKIVSFSPLETTVTSPKNEHCMEPWGCVKGAFVPSQNCCSIILNNKSQDGLTFDYYCSKDLSIGDYVFMDDSCLRSWIKSFTSTTVTFEEAWLIEGTGIFSIGCYRDELVRDWKSRMFLWGLVFHSIGHSDDDFLELSIVDESDLFKTDEVCQALFGVNAIDAEPYILGMGFENIGEFGSHWTKYYDEQWVINAQGTIKTPDGAPGELMPGLFLRMKYFPTESKLTKTHFYIDYSPTSLG